MNIRVIIRLFAYVAFICGFGLHAAAQSNPSDGPKVLRVQYNAVYQLKDSYTIIYDNTVQAAKLEDFRVLAKPLQPLIFEGCEAVKINGVLDVLGGLIPPRAKAVTRPL